VQTRAGEHQFTDEVEQRVELVEVDAQGPLRLGRRRRGMRLCRRVWRRGRTGRGFGDTGIISGNMRITISDSDISISDSDITITEGDFTFTKGG
jgi:hypothetical protein